MWELAALCVCDCVSHYTFDMANLVLRQCFGKTTIEINLLMRFTRLFLCGLLCLENGSCICVYILIDWLKQTKIVVISPLIWSQISHRLHDEPSRMTICHICEMCACVFVLQQMTTTTMMNSPANRIAFTWTKCDQNQYNQTLRLCLRLFYIWFMDINDSNLLKLAYHRRRQGGSKYRWEQPDVIELIEVLWRVRLPERRQ